VAKLNIYNIEGKTAGEVNLDTIPEGFTADRILIARSLKRQLSNARIPCAHAKTRSEVSGGGKKPFRQKGTGHARQGSTRAVQWRHGGVAFGPKANRNWEIGMNRKERSAALKQLVWMKIQDGEWFLFNDLPLDKPSTRSGWKFLETFGRKGKFLILVPEDEKYHNVWKSLRNISYVTILPPERLNTFDLLNSDTVLAHEKAFDKIRETWKV
jgi:large subunit ribosomal protein L4